MNSTDSTTIDTSLDGLNRLLFKELQKAQSLTDPDHIALEVRRIDAVTQLAGRIMEANRLKLDTVKTALAGGFKVDMPALMNLNDK